MLKLKLLLPFLLFTSILNFRILSFDNKQTPNLLSSPEEIKEKIMKALRNAASNYQQVFPKGWERLIKNLGSETSIKFNKILFSNIDSLRFSHGFPPDVINKLKKLKYLERELIYDSFIFEQKKTQSSIDSTFGIGARIDSQYIYIAYVKAITSGQLIRQYDLVPTESCHGILWWRSCYTIKRIVYRGFNNAETNIILETLKAKYAQILNEVLDLENQKMIDKFKEHARNTLNKYPYPYNYGKFIVNTRVTVDFGNSHGMIIYHYLFPQSLMNQLKSIENKPNTILPFFTTNIDTIHQTRVNFVIGVAYVNENNKMRISYATGIGDANLYHGYCDKEDDCNADDECKKDCETFRKKYKNIENALRPGGSNEQQKIKNNKDIIYKAINAELIRTISKILNGIQFD